MPPLAPPEHSCSMCQSDDNSRMICCDQCTNWFHFDCVGVTDDIANHPWICPSCVKANMINPTAGSTSTPVPFSEPVTSKVPAPAAPALATALPPPPTRPVQLSVDLQLKMLEEERALERKYLQRKYQLMMEASGTASQPLPASHSMPDDSFRMPPCHSSPLRPAPSTAPELHLLEGTGGVNETAMLNSSQIAARHAVAKELPVYSGEPEEWPLFIATYENTTRLCGYTPEENMVRLQRCLRGKALDAVRCQLLHPANLEHALSTLKMLFGRPEIIVHSLIEKINKIPAPKPDRLSTLVDFALAVRNMVATVKACNLEEHLYNITLLQGLVERLPTMVKLNWATHRLRLPRVSLLEFSDWLYTVAEAASTVTMSTTSQHAYETKPRRSGNREDGFLSVHSEPQQGLTWTQQVKVGCVVCRRSCNAVENCLEFLNLSHSDRWAALRDHKLCRTCLGTHRGPCRSNDICGKNGCTFKHHRLLHNERAGTYSATRSSAESEQGENPSTNVSFNQLNCNTHRWNEKSVLFQYIPVVLHHNGNTVHTYAFVDCGSHITLLEDELAADLNLRGEKHPLCIRWTADHCRFEDSAERVSLHVSGTVNEDNKFLLSEVFTVKDLKLPAQTLSVSKLCRKYGYLKGLPVESYNNIRPRLLIGMNNIRLGHALDSREGGENGPIATKTRLGWTIFGTCLDDHPKSSTVPHSFHICSHSTKADENLHAVVKNYFALDSIGITASRKELLSVDDERALKILQSNTRLENGRYTTSLLWKYDDVRLPNNKPMALRRHNCLVKRMKREPTLGETLKNKIADYVRKGYIRKLAHQEMHQPGNRVWYLPIFPVFNENKPGKVRIVWDAAAAVGGTSLNSVLLKGPDRLEPLPFVLYKFRERRVAICGDIEEMFHQVRMNEEDQQSQRFLFQDKVDATEPDEYVMTVMTFGATCSPSSANFVINQNAERFEGQLPEAARAIRKCHYVDDMLASVDTEFEAIQLAEDVRFIHQQGGFKMRGWISNSPTVTTALNSENSLGKSLDLNKEIALEKVLGMWWNTDTDEFQFKLSKERHVDLLSGAKHPTKRELLSMLMSVYDPLGLIANFLMPLKLLLQEIWRSGVSWDEPIEFRHMQKWRAWLNYLPQAGSVRIPRCYTMGRTYENLSIELHTFVDASEFGYCAVSYLRFEQGGQVDCVLVGAKTRVAPLKFVSIPRLELQAAVVGTRLAKSIQEGHSIRIMQRYFWTDAADVLCWLRSDHRTYSQFVAFRISDILESSDISEWKYVPTKENVADEGTKIQRQIRLDAESRWRRGPPFLWGPRNSWPLEPVSKQMTTLEIRPSMLHHSAMSTLDCLQADKFSNWHRLQRITALVARFPLNIRQRIAGESPVTGPLASAELLRAEIVHYKRAQRDVYYDEIALLTTSGTGTSTLPKGNRLYKLNPIIDDDGVLRIHGRIDACDYVGKNKRLMVLMMILLMNVLEYQPCKCVPSW
ncbi:uncharacterized protein LOC134288963 [Aedes albopictus]|uniref:PHD-type domain-containing protein n=1 Tax=Aedes albopictus TaxID=7160 RepID=A0ABM1YW87_AEDAL